MHPGSPSKNSHTLYVKANAYMSQIHTLKINTLVNGAFQELLKHGTGVLMSEVLYSV